MAAGWQEGRGSYERAMTFRQAQSERGRRSAESRYQTTGSAQPSPSRTRTEPEPWFEPNPNHGSNAGRTESEPIERSNNRKIEESNQAAAAASNDLSNAPAREAAAAADPLGMDGMQAAPPARARRDDWPHWRQTHPRVFVSRSDEDGCAADWRTLFNRAGPEIMSVMYDRVLPTLKSPRHGIGYAAAVAWINANCEE
jgi:hypothetical protein